jgi:hypothetical protein
MGAGVFFFSRPHGGMVVHHVNTWLMRQIKKMAGNLS